MACVRARAVQLVYFSLSLWPLCGYHFFRKRKRIPRTVSEDVLPEDDFFSENDWHPEDEFRRANAHSRKPASPVKTRYAPTTKSEDAKPDPKTLPNTNAVWTCLDDVCVSLTTNAEDCSSCSFCGFCLFNTRECKSEMSQTPGKY